jgi:hypothetical protein
LASYSEGKGCPVGCHEPRLQLKSIDATDMSDANHNPEETIELTIRVKRSVVEWLERAKHEFGLRNTAEVASRVLDELINDQPED